MPVLIISALRTQTGRSVVVLWLSLGMGPALMSYYALRHVTRRSNVCFIGPTMFTAGSDEEEIGEEEEDEGEDGDREAQYSQQIETPMTDTRNQLESEARHHSAIVLPSDPKSSPPGVEELLQHLYGSYRAFDGASYYYVKTPLEDGDTEDNFFALSLSGTSLLSRLAPRTVQRRKERWRLQDVQQQRRQQLLPNGNRQQQQGARRKALNHGSLSLRRSNFGLNDTRQVVDPSEFENKSSGHLSTVAPRRRSRHQRLLQESSAMAPLYHSSISWDRGHRHDSGGLLNRWCVSLTNNDYSNTLLRYCTGTVPSVVADASVEPHFPELPLDPPPRHRPWRLAEASAMLFDTSGSRLLPPLPWEISVECHLRWGALPNVHYGPILQDDHPSLPGSPWRIPGTVVLMVVHIVAYLVQRRRSQKSPPAFTQLRNRVVVSGRMQPQQSSEELFDEDETDDEDGDFASFDDNLLHHAMDHPSILHLVFVLWNIWWLGAALEEEFSTLPYLAWHCSLLFLCAFMSWLWTQRRTLGSCFYRVMRRTLRHRHGSSSHAEEQSVWKLHLSPPTATCANYISVLLAWMAVASCECEEISPFPLLLPHWSISTLKDLLWEDQPVSPLLLVNLVLVVTIVARNASWASHAGGLLCGYCLVHPINYNLLSPSLVVPLFLLSIHWLGAGGGVTGNDGVAQKNRCKSEDMIEFQKNKESGTASLSPQRRTENASNGTTSKVLENFSASIPESDEEMMMLMEDVILNDSGADGNGGDDVGESEDADNNAPPTSPIATSFLNSGERAALQILRLMLWICSALSILWLDYGMTTRHTLVVMMFHRSVRQILAWEQQSSLNTWGSTFTSSVSASSFYLHAVLWVLAADAATAGAWVAAPTMVTSSAARTFHNSNMTFGLGLLVARFVFNASAFLLVASITTTTDGSPNSSTHTILRYLLSCATLVGDTIRRVLCRKNIQR